MRIPSCFVRTVPSVLLALPLSAFPASAQTIFVDDLEDVGPNWTPVTTRVIGGVTVTISPAAGTMTARTYFDSTSYAFTGAAQNDNAPLVPGNVSGSRFISTSDSGTHFMTHQPITFDFSTPVGSFGLTTVDLLESGSTPSTLTLRALDSTGAVIVEHTRTGDQGDSGLDLDWLVTSSSQGIAAAVLTGSIAGSRKYGLDDLLIAEAELGTTYCNPAIPNSTGLPGTITAMGSVLVADNDVTLTADQLPPEFGYFLTSQSQAFLNPPGSNGFLCLGGGIGRYNQPQNVVFGPTGSIQLDLTAVPQPTGLVVVQPGDTWNFQCWYRELGGSSNFTDAVSVTFM